MYAVNSPCKPNRDNAQHEYEMPKSSCLMLPSWEILTLWSVDEFLTVSIHNCAQSHVFDVWDIKFLINNKTRFVKSEKCF